MKIYIAQLNPTIGALEANERLIREAYDNGVRAGADIIAVPELAVSGYPPLDLLDRQFFVRENLRIRDALAAMTGPAALIFGCVAFNGSGCGKPYQNTAVVAQDGRIVFTRTRVCCRPTTSSTSCAISSRAESVSTFELGREADRAEYLRGFLVRRANPRTKLYCENPVDDLAAQQRRAASTSPRRRSTAESGRLATRLSAIARQFAVPLVYVNQVGGNDELLFDGSSIVIDDRGRPFSARKSFESTPRSFLSMAPSASRCSR